MTDNASITHDWIEQPEGRLRVARAGSGGQPVLLLSGGGIDNAHLSWARMMPALARDRAVYALDWPKQGGSMPWNGVADHERLLGAVAAVLDHYEIDRADVVGMSQGGALTLATAIEYRDRVRRIVAIAPGGTISFPPVVHQLLWLTAKLPLLNDTLPSMVFRTRAGVAKFVRSSLIPGPVDDFEQIVDDVMAEVERRGGSGSTDWQNTSIDFWRMRVDLRPQLHTIACPTLFIQGDKDVGVAPKHTRAAAALVPGARLEMIEGGGHWVNRQEPERVNDLVREFLA
ncbi:alpha/beta fold hydrolase [Pseudactinotalea sp.]|uniref:alpha/beta fold hydrolase n=1 Tax=Pseudactinotalea sp. TaxID=1926260 RepID=UPI003B3AB241